MMHTLKQLIPDWLLNVARPVWHYTLAVLGALLYRFPSKEITVIGVTGTKGKTSTVEIISAVLEKAGYSTAVSSTLRFKIADENRRNMKKMTMPGRLFLQRFFRKAVKRGCDYAVVEMTSQGVLQYRHAFVYLDALVFTNISPEHIEAHGSFENYLEAKLTLARLLEKSPKAPTIMVANADDPEGHRFLEVDADVKTPFSKNDGAPFEVGNKGISFTFRGTQITSPLAGEFNLYNILAAATLAEALDVPTKTIKEAVEQFNGIRGRLERVRLDHDVPAEIRDKQDFSIIVDYAHTPDSLEKVYDVFPRANKICVLGNTGGGRDKWKRKEMAKIAENHCEHIILTNEDPYNEDPRAIVEEMAKALSIPKYEIIMDRRKAIRAAIERAKTDDVILITGKGTDPYIMGPRGSKIPWDDATVVREELYNHFTTEQ